MCIYIYIVSILVFRQKNELSKNKSIRKTLVTCQHKNEQQKFIIKLVCRDSNNNFSIFLFKRRDFVINAVLLISSILNICFIIIGSKILLLYPRSTGGGGGLVGILYYLCLSYRPSKIFFITFISATIDGRNLILGHKLHIVGSVFGPVKILLPVSRLNWFLYTLNIYAGVS